MSTTDQTITTKCPDWCERTHNSLDEPGDHEGPSWPSIPSTRGGGYNSVQIGAGSDAVDGVTVSLEAPSLRLTPERATEAAVALTEAAAWAMAHRDAGAR